MGRRGAARPPYPTSASPFARLTARGLLAKQFAELDGQLEKAGVMLKRGTMLDATLIDDSTAPLVRLVPVDG